MALQRRLVVALSPFFDGNIIRSCRPACSESCVPFRSCLAWLVRFSAVE
jgi:hypothetical protein